MIFPRMPSDSEFAMAESGDLEEVVLAIVGFLSLWVCGCVVVCGRAVVVRDAHVH